jgi:hypothetical protein
MNVKVYGFEWIIDQNDYIDAFFSSVEQKPLIEKGYTLAVSKIKNYWSGIILSVRDQKKMCILTDSEEGFEISARDLEANTNLVDINLFLLNMDTRRGLYMYYKGSISLNKFCRRINKGYKHFLKMKGIKGGNLSYAPLYDARTLSEFIDSLEMVSNIELEAVSYSVNEPAFMPVLNIAKRVITKASYGRETPVQQIKNCIKELLRGDIIKGAKVTGIDPEKRRVIYRLLSNHQVFGVYDYDEFIGTVHIKAKELTSFLKSSKNAQILMELAKEDGIRQLLSIKAA